MNGACNNASNTSNAHSIILPLWRRGILTIRQQISEVGDHASKWRESSENNAEAAMAFANLSAPIFVGIRPMQATVE